MRNLHAALLVAVLAAGCSKPTAPTTPARAFKIASRDDLIGGKRALAEVGDYKLTNGVVHAIVQDVGTSRGFGAFGGSLIDIDLVRGTKADPVTGPNGNDYFTEMFPAFFLQAIEPGKVEVLSDGSDGSAATIRVSGHGGVFLSMVKPITDLVIPKNELDYTCDYSLAPGQQYVKIVTTLINPTPTNADFPISIPLGFVTLLGEGQRLFVPGQAGFDMRFHLQDTVFKRPAALTALPGEVTPMWTTSGDGVSYALVPGRQVEKSYLMDNPTYYPTATPDSLLIPIASSSFLGSFWAKSPATIPPKVSVSYTAYLAVGSGDVASVQKVVYDLTDTVTRSNGKEFVVREKTAYGTVSGRVREAHTLMPLSGISVVLRNDQGEWVSQAQTLADGTWTAPLPAGTYTAVAVERSRSVASSAPFTVTEGQGARADVELERPAQLQVVVRDAEGRAVPAKISVEGIYENASGLEPRQFLYDLKAGEGLRQTDLDVDDPAKPETRRYLERTFFAAHGASGRAIRPGHYKVYASRGIEYDLPTQEVDLVAGKTTTVALTLTQVLPTPGWISGDFHVHSVKSVDSDMGLDDRVTSYAVEGVDFLAATDHNYVTDYQPTIEGLQLTDWVRAAVGLELTSLEMGHFNAFPLVVQPGPVAHGSFRWFMRPPGELFAQLRGLGRDPQKTIVQVNHPRDSILGYFNAFDVGTYTGAPVTPTSSFGLDVSDRPDGGVSPYAHSQFSTDFDALEVYNGKRIDSLFSYRIPLTPLPGAEPSVARCDGNPPAVGKPCIPAPGELLQQMTTVTLADGSVQQVLQPVYPGVIDDWLTMLARGQHITATGNSDSHSEKAEAGLPRTYLQVGDTADGTMRALDEGRVFDALRTGHAFVTNGPIVDITVNGKGLGETVVAGDGKVELRLKVQAAPWVDVTRVIVRRGGRDLPQSNVVLETIAVPPSTAVVRLETTRTYTVPDQSFLIVEAYGDRPLWPVYTPYEMPSLQVSDAVGVIGGSFGFGNKFGKYEPPRAQQVVPFAFTNPVWIDRVARQGVTAARKVLPVSNSEPFTPRQMPDLRRLFGAFHSDPE